MVAKMLTITTIPRLALALIFVIGFSSASRLEAATDLSFLKGKYGGKYTAVYLISQGKKIRVTAGGTSSAVPTRSSAKITTKITIGSDKYQQTITLNPDGTATTTATLMGGKNAPFSSPASGTYRVAGRTVSLTFPNPAGYPGSLSIRIGFLNSNSTLSISSVLALTGSETYYATVIGA